ncbi:hypothetical protein [Alkaliphilus crotonatoxidans]
MVIKDVQGKYEIKVDTQRRIVYENPNGLWEKSDFERFKNDYINKVGPLIKGKKWAKYCDLIGYRTSNITDEIGELNIWCEENGLTHAALLVESAIIKMQMNRSVKGTVYPQAFTDPKEADAWLKSQGF